MGDQITYRAINQRCESVAKEIVSEIACFDTAKEANTFDSWQSYLDALESVEEESSDHARESVDSWDWTIYTYRGMEVCQAVDNSDLCEAESEYTDIWNEPPDGLWEYASRLAYLILVRKVTEAICEEVETCRELAESLQENCNEDGPEGDDYILSDCGALGAGTKVTQYGEVLYTGDMDGAQAFIRDHMETEKFWPGVWYQDDHGGISQVFLSDGKGGVR